MSGIRASFWKPALPALLFLLLGAAFFSRAGIQTDEALFAGPLCRPWRFFSVPVGHYQLPLMNMPYNGTLKTWLYAPILLRARHPGAALVRMPTIFLGAATIALFWSLLRRLHGGPAAWAGSIVLATDTSFLLTTTFDWGPVALQHFLLVAALFFAVRWFQTGATASLTAAGFCCGLAFWDKAEFIWVFAGIVIGALPFAAGVRARLTRRQAALALAGLILGSLPLLVYNVAGNPKFGTLHSNPHLSADFKAPQLALKLQVLRATMNGSALFGYLVNEDSAPQPRSAGTKIQRASFAIREIAGEHRHNSMLLAACAALALFPLLWRTRGRPALLFSLISIVVAWLFMAATGGVARRTMPCCYGLCHIS